MHPAPPAAVSAAATATAGILEALLDKTAPQQWAMATAEAVFPLIRDPRRRKRR
jgi:hypothetical protein